MGGCVGGGVTVWICVGGAVGRCVGGSVVWECVGGTVTVCAGVTVAAGFGALDGLELHPLIAAPATAAAAIPHLLLCISFPPVKQPRAVRDGNDVACRDGIDTEAADGAGPALLAQALPSTSNTSDRPVRFIFLNPPPMGDFFIALG